MGKTIRKKDRRWFWFSSSLGYKGVQKILSQPRAGNAVQLGGHIAIGGKIEPAMGLQSLADLLRPVNGVKALAHIGQKFVIEGETVIVDAQLGK